MWKKCYGGDLFSIKVTDPYPADWDACLERAPMRKRGNDARPELEENVSGLEQYETDFLGLSQLVVRSPYGASEFSGRQRSFRQGCVPVLFPWHRWTGKYSVEQIAEASPEAVISDNIFDCYEEDASSSEDAIPVMGEWCI